MITEGVLSTYKLYSSWSHYKIKVEGYGSVNRIEGTNNMYIEGTLVSLKGDLLPPIYSYLMSLLLILNL